MDVAGWFWDVEKEGGVVSDGVYWSGVDELLFWGRKRKEEMIGGRWGFLLREYRNMERKWEKETLSLSNNEK